MSTYKSPELDSTEALPRRRFLVSSAALTLAAASGSAPDLTAQITQEERWLQRLEGRMHRLAFDVSTLAGAKPLLQARNYLDVFNTAYAVKDEQVGVLQVVHGNAFPLLFADAAWADFELGEKFKLDDPATGKPATRNVFVGPGVAAPLPRGAALDALQERGVVFVLCANTLERTASQLAAARGGESNAVRGELLKHLLPAVDLVPAAVVALSRAQAEGFAYYFVS